MVNNASNKMEKLVQSTTRGWAIGNAGVELACEDKPRRNFTALLLRLREIPPFQALAMR